MSIGGGLWQGFIANISFVSATESYTAGSIGDGVFSYFNLPLNRLTCRCNKTGDNFLGIEGQPFFLHHGTTFRTGWVKLPIVDIEHYIWMLKAVALLI